jgi:hypothetical protein
MSDLRFQAVELLRRLVKAEMKANSESCILLGTQDPLSPTLSLLIAAEVHAPHSPITVTAAYPPEAVVVEKIEAESIEEAEAVVDTRLDLMLAGLEATELSEPAVPVTDEKLVMVETPPVVIPKPVKHRNKGK